MLTVRETDRGFKRADFVDSSGAASCGLVENTGDHGNGVEPVFECRGRMILDRKRAAELLPLLLAFVETGKLP